MPSAQTHSPSKTAYKNCKYTIFFSLSPSVLPLLLLPFTIYFPSECSFVHIHKYSMHIYNDSIGFNFLCFMYTICVYIVLYTMYYYNANTLMLFVMVLLLVLFSLSFLHFALARFKYFNPNWFLVWQIPEQQSNYEAWSACIWAISSSDWAESQQKSYRSIANRPLHQA